MNAAVSASPSRGHVSYWVGVGLALLGIVLMFLQFGMRILVVPWYMPALASLGAVLLLVSVLRRMTIVRVITLVLLTALAGLEWFFIGSMMKLPDYQGPARAGAAMPAFTATLADGRKFTDADLRDGTRRVMVFFRGRW